MRAPSATEPRSKWPSWPGEGRPGGVHGATSVTRLKFTALTAGIGNPVLATAELAGAATASALALLVPVAALALVAASLGAVLWMAGRRRK